MTSSKTLLTCILFSLLACQPEIQEDEVVKKNPHILELDQYYPSQGKPVNMDSVRKPQWRAATSQKISLNRKEFSPKKTKEFYPSDKRSYYTEGTRANDSMLSTPPFVASTGKKVKANWPHWTAVQTSLDAQYIHNYSINDIGKGLRSGSVWTLLEDRSGKIWIGTWGAGLSVWDGSGLSHYTTKEGLSNNAVIGLLEDRQGQIWIATHGGGVSMWDGSLFTHFDHSNGLLSNDVSFLMEDSDGQIWIATSKGLNKWTGNGFFQYTEEQGIRSYSFRGLLEDKKGDLWVATSDAGIMVVSEAGSAVSITYYTKDNGLLDDYVLGFWKKQDSDIFINTIDGFHTFRSDTIHQFTFPADVRKSKYPGLPFWEDPKGKIWLKEQQDISIWDGEKLMLYPSSQEMGEEILIDAMKDSRQRIWLATNGGGLKILNETDIAPLSLSADLSNQFVRTLFIDQQDRIWFGHATDGLSVSDGDRFINNSSISSPATYDIWDILEDQKEHIWYGGYNGLGVWNENSINHFTKMEGLQDLFIRCLVEAENGDIWFGSQGGGIGVWNGTGFRYYTEDEGLSDDNIRSLLKDREGGIWIGTYKGGVNLWKDSSFTHFTTEEGLPGNSVFKIVEDREGRIWLGTDNGLCFWDGSGFFHFSELQGLPHYVESLIEDRWGNIWVGAINGVHRLSWSSDRKSLLTQYYEKPDAQGYETIRSMVIDEEDVLWMSTPRGLSRLDLNKLKQDSLPPSLAIVDLQAILDEIDWRQVQSDHQTKGQILSKRLQLPLQNIHFDSIRAQSNLPFQPSFPKDFNNLHLRWTASHTTPEKLRYTYILERKGQKSKWSPLVRNNEVEFTDLRPGHYSFKARAVAGNGLWSEIEEYTFRIRPPWWLSKIAFMIYISLGLVLFYSFYRFQLKRQLTMAETERLKELDEVKNRLYVNITHEFRTPLTIILGVAKQLKTQVQEKVADQVEMIRRNGHLLLQLINQMLDLSKLEVGKLELNYVRQDIIFFLKYLSESFHSAAEDRAVQLHFLSNLDELVMDYDPKYLQQIVFNLLSNALKFSPEGGHIYIQISQVESEELEIKVKDTGIGLRAEDLDRIFDRFYQSDTSNTRRGEGTGIGLALVKELMKLMGGDIKVKSKAGKGTEFTLLLPIRNQADASFQGAEEIQTVLPVQKEIPKNIYSNVIEAPKILIIEDSRDVSQYIANCLSSHFHLEFAQDGQEGTQKAMDQIPDVIISDVMMPLKDGFELCEELKEDRRTSHIPIILLTARADQKSKLEGLQHGADVYLTKPFDEEELLVHINNLLLQQNRLKKHYLHTIDFAPAAGLPELLPQESSFVQQVKSTITRYLSDSNFTVHQLSREVALSPSQLHRKLTALTGYSASKMIRQIRLDKAKALLQDLSRTISEVAYECGFNDPDYFSKVFKTEFGMIPTEYRKKTEGVKKD